MSFFRDRDKYYSILRAITGNNADTIHWRIYAALGGDELNRKVSTHYFAKEPGKSRLLVRHKSSLYDETGGEICWKGGLRNNWKWR